MSKKLNISLAQLNYHTGNFEYNTHKIITHIQQAIIEGVDLIVFSELCVCGYPPRDFMEFSSFVEQCNVQVQTIAKSCVGISAIVGSPQTNHLQHGKALFNSAFYLSDGKVKQVIHKSLLPNYDIFDEYRYFEPNKVFEVIECKGYTIALTICEDLWNINDNPIYTTNPMDELVKYQPDLIVNIAASPFSNNQAEQRLQVMTDNVKKYKLPLFYVNQIGAQTQLIFDGGSMALNANAEVVDRFDTFVEQRKNYEVNKSQGHTTVNALTPSLGVAKSTIALTHDALVMGIKEYFTKQGFTKAIIGLSGGIDSAIVAVLAAKALGNTNVKVVLLPSPFSSQHSIDDAVALAKNLNLDYEIINITPTYDALTKTLADQFSNTPFGIAEENLQSRSRGVILMALSNKFGYILLNTSNKSELAVGYGTLYGDMCGGLSVIGDLYKTQVYELAHFINIQQEIIPQNIITKEPSAELRPNQKDIDSLPDYATLDSILKLYIEERLSPAQIVAHGYEKEMVAKALKLVNNSEWKRIQAPPVLRVSSKAFGPGRRMPIVAKYLA